MSTETKKEMDTIPPFIKQAIESEVNLAVIEELEKAQKRIEQRKATIISGVMLNLERIMSIERMGETVVISVKFEEKKNDKTK